MTQAESGNDDIPVPVHRDTVGIDDVAARHTLATRRKLASSPTSVYEESPSIKLKGLNGRFSSGVTETP